MSIDRQRTSFWSGIGSELGITWEEAENLHWTMGKDGEMSQRTGDDAPSAIKSSEAFQSVVHADAVSSTNPTLESQEKSCNLPIPRFEDYRSYHFNTTMPPQIRASVPVGQVAFGKYPSNLVRRGNARGFQGANPHSGTAPGPNLTVEGKRQVAAFTSTLHHIGANTRPQAQAAGEILRARAASSRHRKAVISPTEQTNHQTRWANYKAANTSSASIPFAVDSRSSPVHRLSLEGARQVRLDTLRSVVCAICKLTLGAGTSSWRQTSLSHKSCASR